MAHEHHHGGGHHLSHESNAPHVEHRFASDDDAPPAAPYPYIYSRDPWDVRRWRRWSSEGPSMYRVGRLGALITWVILGGVALLWIVSVVAQVRASAGH